LLTSAELFDPRNGLWTRAGALGEARAEHSATLLADGQVLAVGGLGASGALASVERYDPTTSIWRRATSLPGPRYGHSTTLLRDGRLLVAGGRAEPDGPYLSTSLLYDPERDAWEAGPALVW
jgi:N-acetylneuraminic acid mutarotase